MTAQAVQNPFPTFTGSDGQPLDAGYVYFGQAAQDPRQYPVAVYYDAALTIPATQPLRTTAGFIYRNGSPANVWLASGAAVSVMVLDSAQRQVSYTASWQGVVDAAGAAAAAASQPYVTAAAASATASAASAAAAATARDAAQAAQRIYASTAAGIAATTNGQYFYVVSAVNSLTLELWKNNAGTALDTGKRLADASATLNAVIAVVGKNLFNQATVSTSTALDVGTGNTAGAVGRNVSVFIPVDPSSSYSYTQVVQGCFYTAAFTFIGPAFAGGASGTVASPATAAYVRLDVFDGTLSTCQWEKAAAPTLYESYRLDVPSNRVAGAALYDYTLTNDKAEPFAFGPEKLLDANPLNLHDGTKNLGLKYNIVDGKTVEADSFFDSTNWIGVKPSTTYTVNGMSRVFSYDKNRALISVGSVNTFTTAANCRWVRFNLPSNTSFRFTFNEGTLTNSNDVNVPHWYELAHQAPRKRLYNLTDAWYAWLNAEKFPIMFVGDSTVWGTGTTPTSTRVLPYIFGTEESAPGAFPARLETLLRAASASTTLRVYNSGYHGTTADHVYNNIASMVSGDFADAKMMGIVHGINDRVLNYKAMASTFRSRIEWIIVWCLEHGIQPFLCTAQPMLMPYDGTGNGLDNEHSEVVSNQIKRQLAAKWNLELVDINKYGRDYQTWSSALLKDTIYEAGGGVIHWGNTGHQYEADLLFAHICPRTIWSEKGELLSFSTQLIKSTVHYANVTQLAAVDAAGFKLQAKYTKGDATDERLQEFWVFNNYRGRMKLTAYAADAIGAQYVKLNGVTTPMATVSQVISSSLEIGLHHIEAWSGPTTAANWRGFKLELV